MSSLDDILIKLEDETYQHGLDSYRNKTKQQIKELFLELIGEDEDYPHTESEQWGRNLLRSQLRKKVKEL